MLPDPPMTTMATNRNDRLTMNALGSTYCCLEPNSRPARPPRVAPMAKAHSLNLKPATPITAAASSSSRIASQARPTRLFSSRRARKMMRIRTTSASQYQRSASIVLKNARPSISGPGGTGHLGDAGGAVGDVVEVARGDADDLAEAERHDGEVVTAQPQGRRTEEDAGDQRHQDGDRDADRERDRPLLREAEPALQRLDDRRVGRPEQGDRVGAEGVEADVAEVEQSGQSDHDVEADGHDHVDDDQEQHARPVRPARGEVGADVGERQDVEVRQVEREGDHQQHDDPADRLGGVVPALAELEAAVGVEDLAHARAFPRDSPSRPVGRNIRTTTRTTNAYTLVQLESQIAEA